MTDNEIIRVLEKSIPAAIEQGEKTVAQILKNAVDLINRQKSEIEKLKSFENTSHYWCKKAGELVDKIETTKSEAVKEFAERLKEKNDNPGKAMFDVYEYYGETIDNLVKEMTEEKE